MHVPEVLAVDEGEGGAVRQPLGEVLGHVVRRRNVLVQDQRRVLGRADILHLKGDKVFTESATLWCLVFWFRLLKHLDFSFKPYE